MRAVLRTIVRVPFALGITIGLVGAMVATLTTAAATPTADAAPPPVRYVATTGTVGGNTSCADPGYVGATHVPIAAAIAAAAPGDTVYLCPGTYQIGSTLVVDKSITVAGAGIAQSILDGGETTRIMSTTNSAISTLFSVTVSALQFRNGRTTGTSPRGGAIENALDVTLYVNDSLFRNNRADEHGGAISTGLWGFTAVGSGSLQIARSTFLDNYATSDGGAISDTRFASAISTVVNSTFVRNTVGRGGGAINGGRGLQASASTFLNNSAGATYASAVERAALTGSLILVPDPNRPCWTKAHDDHLYFPWVTVSANVSNAVSCVDSSSTTVTVDSTATSFLAPWGGTTPTVPIGATSSALNAVPAASCPATDQRGVSRDVSDTTCDAGAFEFTASAPGLTPERLSAGIIQGIALEGTITTGLAATGLTEPTFRLATEVTADLPAGLTVTSGTGAVTGTPSATSATGTTYVITAEGTNGAAASALVTVNNCILPLVDGTYRIDSRNDLDIFRQGFCGLSSRYEQETDIAWNAAWSGVGTSGTPFTGTYDGGGHAINGLTMSNNSGYAAFIAYASGATVSALHLDAIVNGGRRSAVVVGDGTTTNLVDVHASGTVTRPSTATSSSCVGGLAGRLATNSLVLRSSFTGTVTVSAGANTGGLVGCVVSSRLERSTADVTVNGVSDVGGLVGYLEQSELTDSYATGTVAATTQRLGGLVGCTWRSRVERSTADVTVNGVSDVGGLVGYLEQSELTDSYATGTVAATTERLGGLVGYADQDSADADQVAVTRSYAATTLSAPQRVGGLVGRAATSGVSASFWQAGLAGTDGIDAIGEATSLPGLTATPLADLKQQSFFSTAGWAIADGWEAANTSNNTWGICDGMGTPFLLWQHDTDPCQIGASLIPPPPTTTPANTEPTTPTTTPAASPTTTTAPAISPTTDTSTDVPPALAPGESVAEVGGVRHDQPLVWESPTEVVGRVGELDMRLQFGPTLLGVQPPGVVAPGANAVVMLDGARADSKVTLTLFSTPRLLAAAQVDADGTVAETVTIPVDTPPGNHHLRMQATTANGDAVTVWLAISVETAPITALPATGSGHGSAVIAWWALIGGAACLVLARRKTVTG